MSGKKISLPLSAGSSVTDSGESASESPQDPQKYIEELVTTHPVVLFMKGTLDQPMCGFSAKAAAILSSYGVAVYDVNVLADPEIRQAIKDYSDWPTLPQVYIKGEFVGGSDLLGQMYENGQLDELIKQV